ncbi:uncharacterized protein L3040_002375 [Drepanopeziza brunnea f. sp. 'multigermtubi']|uniref:uncharacterized protein n=1 Tax=Drepanopeziza brunnea f. sp. 'multigermtubi' TaxID=698441 RepID=UPI002396C5A9|nr:hypothetical protein L3040_002375 [Drepanopeziza brunnea f. sp. 'multigermtubi']
MPRLRLYYDTISKASLISLIRRFHIRVRLDCDPNFSAKKATESFTGMEELTIEVFQAQFGGSDYEVLTLFEDIRGVKRARVYGSVRAFPEYVGWLQNSMMTPQWQPVERFVSERVDLPHSGSLWPNKARRSIHRCLGDRIVVICDNGILVKSINNYIKIFIKLYMFRV